MTIPTVTALPDAPTRADSATFDTRADAFMPALVTLAEEINATVAATNIATAQVTADAAATAADVVLTHADVVLTHADVALTRADVVSTGEDADATAADRVATAADRVQTGLDAASAAASAAAASAVTGIPVFGAGDAGKAMVVNPGETGYTLGAVQAQLVSGTNIKTINSTSLLGSGDIAVGSSVYRSARTSNTALAAADKGKLIDITSGTFTQTFVAAATLGDGWSCYLRNSGAGDITLDPDRSETIDGLTSFIMYPGETRLVQCTGAALYSIVVNPFYRAFTSSGTFTKPPGYSMFGFMIWSGGNSGSRHQDNPRGGGGGCCLASTLPSSVFGSTETVTVGAGGIAYTGIDHDGGNIGGHSSIGTLAVTLSPADPSEGHRCSGTSWINGQSVVGFDGAAGGLGMGAVKGNLYGAGGGSGYATAAGVSKFGGQGGLGVSGANGQNGTAPGGGGGGSVIGGTSTRSGAGARGEVRVWGVM